MTALPAEAIETMFGYAPNEWWRFLGCGYCNAPRQEPCQSVDGPASRPHARRIRGGLLIHGVLWLLANGYATDVIGDAP